MYDAAQTCLRTLTTKADAFTSEDWNSYCFPIEHANALMNLRREIFRYTETLSSCGNDCVALFKAEAKAKSVQCTSLDGVFDWIEMGKIKDISSELQNSVRDMWSVALEKQTNTLQATSIEGWTSQIDDLVDRKDVCTALVLNEDYASLHSTNETLLKNLRVIGKLLKDFMCWDRRGGSGGSTGINRGSTGDQGSNGINKGSTGVQKGILDQQGINKGSVGIQKGNKVQRGMNRGSTKVQ